MVNVSDYFTFLSGLLEEIDSMNALPSVMMTAEVTKLLSVVDMIKEEARLFQFFNGLDDAYSAQRSQLLIITPFPSVEVAYAAIQQKESQKGGCAACRCI